MGTSSQERMGTVIDRAKNKRPRATAKKNKVEEQKTIVWERFHSRRARVADVHSSGFLVRTRYGGDKTANDPLNGRFNVVASAASSS